MRTIIKDGYIPSTIAWFSDMIELGWVVRAGIKPDNECARWITCHRQKWVNINHSTLYCIIKYPVGFRILVSNNSTRGCRGRERPLHVRSHRYLGLYAADWSEPLTDSPPLHYRSAAIYGLARGEQDAPPMVIDRSCAE